MDLTRALSSSQQDCCNKCGANSACTAFSYLSAYSMCFLKTGVPMSAANVQSTVSFTSGTVMTR